MSIPNNYEKVKRINDLLLLLTIPLLYVFGYYLIQENQYPPYFILILIVPWALSEGYLLFKHSNIEIQRDRKAKPQVSLSEAIWVILIFIAFYVIFRYIGVDELRLFSIYNTVISYIYAKVILFQLKN